MPNLSTPVLRSDEKNRELLRRAYRFALKSPDAQTQTGAYVATPDGVDYYLNTAACNDLPRGIAYSPERVDRPLKLTYVEHSERNAIYAAARHGSSVGGAILVTTWLPCVECSRAIIQAGLVEVLTHASTYPDHWMKPITDARDLLAEAQVLVTEVEGPLGDCAPVRRMGELITP